MNVMLLNNLIQTLKFDFNSSRHVQEIMMKAFPFIKNTGYEFLKCEKIEKKYVLTPVKDQEKDLNLIKEYGILTYNLILICI